MLAMKVEQIFCGQGGLQHSSFDGWDLASEMEEDNWHKLSKNTR